MPTIKVKKEMNLPELIEWAIEKDIKDEKFYSKNGCHISIDYRGHVFLWDIRLNEIFTVEVEEEITEDTVIPKILVKSNYNEMAREHCDSRINQFVYQYTKAIYIVNDDLTMTLIWTKEKGLVEYEQTNKRTVT